MRFAPYSSDQDFLGVLRPDTAAQASTPALSAWLHDNRDLVTGELRKQGALLLRGFDIADAQAFEQIALAVSPDLKSRYLGTSPRNARTTYTFTASELPPHYPIMQHCEMSFLPSAPTRLFFFCTQAPESIGGETPLTDCRAVWAQLDSSVRDRFLKRGIRIVRNYSAPQRGAKLDPWQLKSWPDVFGTNSQAEVERIAYQEGTLCEWREDGGLRLIRDQAAVQPHPETGDLIWFNHLQVFHSEAARLEYRHILRRQPSLRTLGVSVLLEVLSTAKRWLRQSEDFATQCFYADGGEIPTADVKHVLDVFWRNMVFPRWEQGDLVIIDNFRASHGRMPFQGPREILVAFTEGRIVDTAALLGRASLQSSAPVDALTAGVDRLS